MPESHGDENGPDKAFKTLSGQRVDRLYTPEHTSDLDYQRDLGEPGEFPFTRGAYPTMYRERLWTRRQIAGFGTAQATNQRYRFLLETRPVGSQHRFRPPNLDRLRL